MGDLPTISVTKELRNLLESYRLDAPNGWSMQAYSARRIAEYVQKRVDAIDKRTARVLAPREASQGEAEASPPNATEPTASGRRAKPVSSSPPTPPEVPHD